MRAIRCTLGVWAVAAMLFAAPSRATTLFGLVDTGELFASADGGSTWSLRATLPVPDAVAITAGESASDLFLVTRSGTLYRSPDSGVSWASSGTMAANDVVAMVIRPLGDLIVLTTSGSVWRSTDGGSTFLWWASQTASNCVALSVGDANILFALAETGEVSRSGDGGVTWPVVGVAPLRSAVGLRVEGGSIYALSGSGDVARSTDGGVGWSTIGTASQVDMTALTHDGTNLVMASKEGMVATSFDGSVWTIVGAINQLSVVALGNDTPTVSSVGPIRPPAHGALTVHSVWPNPVGSPHGRAHVAFTLSAAGDVTLELFDVAGRRLRARPAQAFPAGSAHSVAWSPGPVPSGTYFLRIRTESGTSVTRKISFVR